MSIVVKKLKQEHVVKVQYVHSEDVLQLRYIKAECADVILVPDSPFPCFSSI